MKCIITIMLEDVGGKKIMTPNRRILDAKMRGHLPPASYTVVMFPLNPSRTVMSDDITPEFA